MLITPGVSLYFDITPKVVLLLSATAVALLLPGAWLVGLRLLWNERWARLFLILLAAHLLSLFASTALAVDPGISWGGSNWRRFGLTTQCGLVLFAGVFACFLVSRRSELRGLLRCSTAAGWAAAIYGILQYFGIDPLVSPAAYHVGEGEWTIVRTPGTLGHAGYFATYLLTVVFWALALGRMETSRPARLLAYVTAAAAAFAIVLSGTRGAILGLIAGAAAGWLWLRPRWNRRLLGGVLLASCALGAFYYSPLGEKLRGRTRWYIEDAAGGGRLLLWRDSLRMFSEGPWWSGFGLETYSAAFPPYLSRELASAYPNRYYESPHNIFVDALTSQGVAGLLLLTGWVFAAAAGAWSLRKQDCPAGAWLAAAFLAALGSNQFVAFTLPTALCFYLSAALLVVMSIPEPKTPAAERPQRWPWLALAPAAVVLLIFSTCLAAADVLLLRVQRDAEGTRIPAAIADYEEARRLMPWGMNVDLWFSRAMMAASQQAGGTPDSARAWTAATDAAQRAAERAPERQAARYNLALIHGLQNDAPRAEAALRSTIAAAPNWYKPHWMLAQLLRETGHLDEARREAEIAQELNGGANPEVAETWEQLRPGSKNINH